MRVTVGDNGEKKKRQIYLPGLFLFPNKISILLGLLALLTPPID
jgi:hypothetical protein